MQVVCAWCKDLIHDDTGGAAPEVVSHGICPRCFERAEAEIMALTVVGEPAHAEHADTQRAAPHDHGEEG